MSHQCDAVTKCSDATDLKWIIRDPNDKLLGQSSAKKAVEAGCQYSALVRTHEFTDNILSLRIETRGEVVPLDNGEDCNMLNPSSVLAARFKEVERKALAGELPCSGLETLKAERVGDTPDDTTE